MANYEPHARSNYFRVTDIEKYKELCKKWDLEIIEDKQGRHGFLCADETGLPGGTRYDEETDDYIDADFDGEFMEILADESVVVMQEIGFEKMRYLTGVARAFNNKGEYATINIEDIHEFAKVLGSDVTDCTY